MPAALIIGIIVWADLIVLGIDTQPAPALSSRPTEAVENRLDLPDKADIRRMVRQLSHPLPIKRREAVKQLAAWGPLAYEELQQAATGGDFEAALSARDLLQELRSAILIGARVRLEVSRSKIAWDEPITLTICAHNPTPAPICVPWAGRTEVRDKTEAGDGVDQVAAMLDVADFLSVTGPDDKPIELRVEPIERDQAVYRAVNARARGEAPTHQLASGKTARLNIPLFNRGWARYPMLSAGKYTIILGYQPPWSDQSWTDAEFGLVRSTPVTVEVTKAAPESIKRSQSNMVLELVQTDKLLIAKIVNTWDRDLWINMNIGGEMATHAKIEWQLFLGDDREIERLELEADVSGPAFQPNRLHQLRPGEMLTVSRVPVAVIDKKARRLGISNPKTYQLNVRYTNLANPEQLLEILHARGQKADIPVHIFTGSLSSEPIAIEISGKQSNR